MHRPQKIDVCMFFTAVATCLVTYFIVLTILESIEVD